MTITQILEIGGFLAAILTVIWNYLDSRAKRAAMEQRIADTISNLNDQMQKMWTWKDEHQRNANDIRMDIQKDMSNLNAKIAVHDTQYVQILKYLDDISNKIDKMEKRLDLLHNGI